MSNYDIVLKEKTEYVNNVMKEFAPKEEGMQKLVFEAMNYSFLAGGKRLRPLIMLETYRMFGGSSEEIKPYMAALEMIHTYSLIHDDLPAMDNDDYRRGRKTNHIVYGENNAILAGDGLLNYAFEVVANEVCNNEDTKKCAKAFKVLSDKAGVYGMIGGQTIDVNTEGQPVSMETLLQIHKLKTAALIEASMMIGAIMAGASDEDIDKCEKIAQFVGLAFQIQDDILDVTSNAQTLGKPVLSDEKNNKTTYVSLVGLKKAKEDVEGYTNKAMGLLNTFKMNNEFLQNLFTKLINRDR